MLKIARIDAVLLPVDIVVIYRKMKLFWFKEVRNVIFRIKNINILL